MKRTSLWSSILLLSSLLFLAACGTQDVESDASLATAAEGERYIVVLRDAPSVARADARRADAADVARAHGLHANRTYGAALVGFAAHVPAPRVNALKRDPRVAYVERDDPVQLFEQTIPTGVQRIFADDNGEIGIDGGDERVDVDVAVIDTGIDFEHPDLNVAGGVDCTVASGGGPPGSRTYTCSETEGTGGDDDHYHGTHVAGTIAALDDGQGVVGVAPGARLWAVKVLDSSGSGYESGIVAGIDWVTEQGDIEVANMSLGGSGYSDAEYDAIQASVETGVAYAVAAGNDSADASNYSPAGFDNVLTVSALADFDGEPGGESEPTCLDDQDDTLADFSNWGDAVDIAAPGVCILSTYPVEEGEYGTISGTSMASPHVAGALASLASVTPAENATDVQGLYDDVTDSGNFNWTDDSGDGVQEPLLDVSDGTLFAPAFVDGDDGGDGDTNEEPVASFTYSCSDLSCEFDASGSSDPDGTIESYAWDFGDGNTSSGETATHTYAAEGTYTVTLTVTDDDGATDDESNDVTVSEPDDGGTTLSLEVTAYKVRGVQHADLSWDGATSRNVDVYRDGTLIDTVPSDSDPYEDDTGQRGGGSADYKVCEADTDTETCSETVTATW